MRKQQIIENFEVIRDYEPTEAEYDLMDRIDDLLWTHRGQWFRPSDISRKLKIHTEQLWKLLAWMDTHTLVMSSGPAGQRKYRLRESGEMGERVREYNRLRLR